MPSLTELGLRRPFFRDLGVRRRQGVVEFVGGHYHPKRIGRPTPLGNCRFEVVDTQEDYPALHYSGPFETWVEFELGDVKGYWQRTILKQTYLTAGEALDAAEEGMKECIRQSEPGVDDNDLYQWALDLRQSEPGVDDNDLYQWALDPLRW